MKVHYHTPNAKHLVIIGGGFAGVELVKKLNGKPIRVTLIDKNNYHTFQPLLYQVASGGLGPDAIAYPLRKLISKFPNIAFRMAEVMRIDDATQEVVTTIGNFHYDYLCIATGSETNYFGNKTLEKFGMPLKSITDALDLRSNILQEFERSLSKLEAGNVDRLLNFVVVGGGPTGVETAGALAEIKKNVLPADYTELEQGRMKVHLIEASPRLLASMSEASSAGALKFLQQLGVDVKLNTMVKDYQPVSGHLELSDGTSLQTDTIIWSAGVKGKHPGGLDKAEFSRSGRYLTNQSNQIKGYENIYAIGDIAQIEGDAAYPNGHPMVAPVAIQQAGLFARNILLRLQGKPQHTFSYFDKGSMATVGRHLAVFESFGIRMQGTIAWLAWMFLHLMLLVGYRNRLMVFINWTWNYLSYQRAIRIITRPFIRKE